jgi:hypothetical protein
MAVRRSFLAAQELRRERREVGDGGPCFFCCFFFFVVVVVVVVVVVGDLGAIARSFSSSVFFGFLFSAASVCPLSGTCDS